MMDVYVAPDIAAVDALHPYLDDDTFRALPIRMQIARQAETVHAAHADGDARIGMHVMCWWPGARGRTLDDVLAGRFTHDDALSTLCREYGFADWNAVEALGDVAPDPVFERALDAMLAGDLSALGAGLENAPYLSAARSRYGHGATLLHYLGANGVESHRQKVPMNAVAVAELLAASGADIEAEAEMYGGGQTAYALASTSAHPRAAGISASLNRVLRGL